MTVRLTDPRLLMQMAAPELFVRVGGMRLFAQITDYEDPYYATVQATLWHYGPPLQPFIIETHWPWLEVRDAWMFKRALTWY